MSPVSPFPFSARHSGHSAKPPRSWIDALPATDGATVTVSGWLHHVRELKSVAFLLLRDATGVVQIVLEESGMRQRVAALPHESVLTVSGTLVHSANAPDGREIHDPEVTVINAAASEPPVELFRPELNVQLPTLLDHAAITLRHPRRAAMYRLVSAALSGFRSALTDQRFVEITTPKIIAAAPEGGADVFALDYFGQPAFLAQSPQLYKQIMVGVYERVFETAPAFRAEPHATSRHLSQFTSLDAEMGFIEDHHTVMTVLTEVLQQMADSMNRTGHLTSLGIDETLVPAIIPEIHFRDALAMLSELLGTDLQNEPDLAPEHERRLGAWAKSTFDSDWLFVTGYPMRKRPFYTHPEPGDPQWSNSFDLLYRGLEVVTGGQRLHRHADYEAALHQRGIDPEPFAGYLEAFRYGMPPHGGFALGLERLVMQLCGVANVRSIALFPRDLHRLTP
ncbi:MAG: aspartate--tRNA(Asn) ligase [Thermomicrobiales bacterium]